MLRVEAPLCFNRILGIDSSLRSLLGRCDPILYQGGVTGALVDTRNELACVFDVIERLFVAVEAVTNSNEEVIINLLNDYLSVRLVLIVGHAAALATVSLLSLLACRCVAIHVSRSSVL